MLIESNPLLAARSFDREREVWKHVGDFTLFFTGLFPDTLPRCPGAVIAWMRSSTICSQARNVTGSSLPSISLKTGTRRHFPASIRAVRDLRIRPQPGETDLESFQQVYYRQLRRPSSEIACRYGDAPKLRAALERCYRDFAAVRA
jgi:hypothetical protein